MGVDSGLPVGNRGTESTPLFFGGSLYVTGLAGHAWALDARTGKPSWTYRREYPSGMVNCCGAINRGFGVLGDTLYMGTVDARLVALNVKDGTVIWEAPVADGSKGYSVTMAPLVVKDKVIVGVSGSEFPTRGFIDAYNARTGNRDGGSTRCPDLERPAATPGLQQKRWRRAAEASGSPAATIPS
jgi:alcohol dehydrogenase (cytochrome c)